jgi:anaerobic magnesium-protoporphyrin IX monomethyl ester cyclase
VARVFSRKDFFGNLVVDHNLSGIKFYDSNFFVNQNRVIKFCEMMLSAKNKFRWSASAHPRGLNRFKNEAELLNKSKLSRLLIGAESGSQRVLDFVKKGCKVAEITNSAELCRQSGINATFTFIVGFPGITDDLEPTFRLIREIKRIKKTFEVKIHFFSPFPGTVLGEVAKLFGYEYPSLLLEWSRHDYYQAHVNWVDGEYTRAVEEFRSRL